MSKRTSEKQIVKGNLLYDFLSWLDRFPVRKNLSEKELSNYPRAQILAFEKHGWFRIGGYRKSVQCDCCAELCRSQLEVIDGMSFIHCKREDQGIVLIEDSQIACREFDWDAFTEWIEEVLKIAQKNIASESSIQLGFYRAVILSLVPGVPVRLDIMGQMQISLSQCLYWDGIDYFLRTTYLDNAID